ncbi:MAG: S24 family peptidase [Granulosicoccus sp.]|nr:S24 family peptidase [Granulosicoccus sp.]
MEPATCTEAETFVLQVLDDTMEPEFNKGCIIVIDPTGLATDGSYVLARQPVANKSAAETDSVDDYVFRQLSGDAANGYTLQSLNPRYADTPPTSVVLSDIVGVIVQRAGVRRRYHKRYD